MRACLYLRVSDPRQLAGFGFDHQRRELPAYAASQGWELVAEYEEPGVSGDSLDGRPAMQRLLRDAATGRFDLILALRDDRFSRGQLADWGTLKETCDEHGITLATPQGILYRPGNLDDDLVTDLRGSLARADLRRLTARMMDGKREGAQQGRLTHPAPPFGLAKRRRVVTRADGTIEVGKRSDADCVIVERQAEAVRLAYRLIASGSGLRATARALNESGHAAAEGGQWSASAVARVIRNPAYRGEWVFGRYRAARPKQGGRKKTARVVRPIEEWIPVRVPAIVTAAEWHAANGALTARRKWPGGRAPANPALLSGLLECALCGRVLCHKRRTFPGRTYRYYACASQEGGPTPCALPRFRAEVLETTAWTAVLAVLREPGLLAAMLEEAAPAPPLTDTRALRRELARLKTEGDRLMEGYRAEAYGLERLKPELARVEQRRVEVATRLASTEEARRATQRQEETRAALASRAADLLTLAEEATGMKQRPVLAAMADRYVVDASGGVTPRLAR